MLAFNAIVDAATIFRITASASSFSSSNLILSFNAALSEGSAQQVYWIMTSRNSSSTSNVAMSRERFFLGGECSQSLVGLAAGLLSLDSEWPEGDILLPVSTHLELVGLWDETWSEAEGY
ncbi:hypothetical protein F2Q69_00063912 [Brassica cretica]|uniref:Uncharacterized protein n=1 Tax=Brassica cretica TaxID=69181 RepID=A0A8S9RL25_BRACR|nr:hypothetical protein F2Q69_00063912 [Brassica cretica]